MALQKLQREAFQAVRLDIDAQPRADALSLTAILKFR
jgi:hypothetical protein